MRAGSAFCAMTSVFLIAYMAFLGALIKKDYPCASTTCLATG